MTIYPAWCAKLFKRADGAQEALASEVGRQKGCGNKPNPSHSERGTGEGPEIGWWPPEKSLFLAGKSTVPQKNLHFCPIFKHFNLRSFTDLAIFRSGPSFFAMKMG